jgi:competence protein ComEC
VRREPLILPCAALAAGILAAHFFYFKPADLAIPGTICAAAIAATWIHRCSAWVQWSVLCITCALLGILTQALHRHDRTPKLNAEDGEVVLLSGCIVSPPALAPDRESFDLQLAPGAVAQISVISKGEVMRKLAYGERVEMPAKVRFPRNYQDPGAFDYAAYLAGKRIYWTASTTPQDIRLLPGSCGSRALSAVFAIRTQSVERLHALYPNDEHTASLLAATLLGETAGVQRRWTEDFRVTGTYHALVISGLHISIVAMSLLFFLRLLSVSRIRAMWAAVAVCWFYAVLAGFHAPAVRAAAGFMLFAAAATVFRRARTLNLLAAIGIVYLLLDPDQLFDPGFQLSFLSVALIAAFAQPAMERWTAPLRQAIKRFDQSAYDAQLAPRAAQWRVELRLFAETLAACTRLPAAVTRMLIACAVLLAVFAAEAFIVSACIQFGLALPMIAYFHRLSVTGLSANILVVPLLSIVVPLGFTAIAVNSHFFAVLTRAMLHLAENIAAWHVRIEPAWRVAAVPLAISIVFAASLLALAIAIRTKRSWVAPLLAGSFALFAVICLQPWKLDLSPGMLEITALDVSQGDSLLVVFPDGKVMLVDAGGFPGMGRMTHKPQLDVGEDVVSPYLWSRHIHRLDYAVLTHGHSDHMGGLAAVLDNFRPQALWIGAEPDTPEWRAVESHAAADHVPIVALNRASKPFSIGGAYIRVLAPAPNYVPGAAAQNDDSLVLELTYGKRRVLLTGDAERPVEDDMVASGLLRPVTLLKVGHHGSRTSSSEEFLEAVQPQFAFISDGYKNQFHHPNPDVLKRLAEHHSAVFRTDRQGLITFLTDGERVEIRTFR